MSLRMQSARRRMAAQQRHGHCCMPRVRDCPVWKVRIREGVGRTQDAGEAGRLPLLRCRVAACRIASQAVVGSMEIRLGVRDMRGKGDGGFAWMCSPCVVIAVRLRRSGAAFAPEAWIRGGVVGAVRRRRWCRARVRDGDGDGDRKDGREGRNGRSGREWFAAGRARMTAHA